MSILTLQSNINFNSACKIYSKNKTIKNISLLIPLRKFVAITPLKKQKEKNEFYYFSNILCYIQAC